MFPHVRDVKGRKVVERTKLNVGELGLRTARRAKVPGNLPHVFSERGATVIHTKC